MGALDGLLVIALEQAVAAPLCTVRLADAGARVIKIERPEGDMARNYDSTVKGTSAYFAWLNRGKESAVLDLKTPDDLALLKRMLKKADVLVQNLKPGALDRLGLTVEVLDHLNPRLIAVSIVGYGQDTEYRDMKAYDLLVQAESGICSLTGGPEAPAKIGVSATDIGTGANAHAAVLEALIERGKTGLGKHIEISMFDSMADWMTVPLLHYEHGGIETKRNGLAHASIYPYGPFLCSDGAIVIAVQNNAEWVRLCRDTLSRHDLLEHPEFKTNPLRSQNRKSLDKYLNPIFAAMKLHEASTKCTQTQIAWARCTEIQNLPDHPALRRRKTTLSNGQTVTIPMSGTSQSQANTKIPALGEHTLSVKSEFTSKPKA